MEFRLKNALFILPNAFTVSSIFCGIYAILHAASENSQDALYHSALAVCFAGFFDMFDGRVARMTKTESDFGMELDSLADVVSFGVAPAVIVYKWALWPLGPIGMFAVFAYAACGAIRLARFNVLAHRDEGSENHFVGLPIPLAAATLVILVIAHFRMFHGLPIERHVFVLGIVIVLGGLMVSTVPYWSFKETHWDVKTATFALAVVVFLWLFGFYFHLSAGLLLLLGGYISAGIIRSLASKILPAPK